MIHYHGTPVGGTRRDAVGFLRGRHALVSYAYQEDLAAALEVCETVVLDNGAFTVWRQGRELDVEGYIEWVRSMAGHPRLAWALIPDVIMGTEADNDRLLDLWPVDLRHIGVPVWHLHESLHRLERLAAYYPTVALGSSGEWATPGTDSWWERMADAMDAVCTDGRPRCRLHGLRMLAPDIVRRLPLASADSTNAAQNAARKARQLNTSVGYAREILAGDIESVQSPDRWAGMDRQLDLFESLTLGEGT